MKKILTAIALVALISGCTSSGNAVLKDETNTTISQKLEAGMTADAVRTRLGDPITTSYTDSGREIWKYVFSKTEAKAINFIPYVNILKSGHTGVRKELTILFDDDRKVVKFNMNESKIDTNTGLLQ